MPAKDQAAYMREYRKRQRREVIMNTTMPAQAVRELVEAQDRIQVLEAEVIRLKRELAARPQVATVRGAGRFVSGPVIVTDSDHPLSTAEQRRARQKVVDEVLGKISRKKETK